MVVVLVLPLLLLPLVDSTSDASTFPILSQINRLNPEGPHFTLPAIRPFVDFGNSAGYYRGSHQHQQTSLSSPLPLPLICFPPLPRRILPPGESSHRLWWRSHWQRSMQIQCRVQEV